MGSGSSRFGAPTNPRVELANSETKEWKRRMEIDTPSLIKLEHGTIRYREPTEHRKPVLPRVGKPMEAPHEGEDRVGKTGYFYHPRLTDFSQNARYTKEEAARFHYVQRNPASSEGKKVFFVVGVGMPDELVSPPEKENVGGYGETVVEDMEGDDNKENAAPESDKKEMETSLDGGGTNDKVDGKQIEPAASSKVQETRDDTQPLRKEFRGQLVPRSCIPTTNELPVKLDRTKIICRSRNQHYYTLEFADPVTVNEELTQSRIELFRGDAVNVTSEAANENQEVPSEAPGDGKQTKEEDEGAEPTKVNTSVIEVTPAEPTKANTSFAEVTPAESVVGESEAEKKDDVSLEILAEGSPPTFGVTFGPMLTLGELRRGMSAKLEVLPTQINIMHKQKYISSQSIIADMYPGELHEGYRYRIIITPM